MDNNELTHLLSSMGVLASFSIAKIISKEEISKITNKIKKSQKEKNPDKIKKLVEKALIESTKENVENEIPPGLIFPKINEKKLKNQMELAAISHSLASKFVERKLTKLQVCFIINFIVNVLEITELDFETFHRSQLDESGEEDNE